MTEQPSGKLYTAVTKYWPRIAAGFIAFLGLVELVLGGLTANSSVEFYLMAWAGTTGGLWFLFEKAEKTISEESRGKVVGWLGETDLKSGIESIPSQFALLFDRVFGERHLSLKCFIRSSIASLLAVAIITSLSLPGLFATDWQAICSQLADVEGIRCSDGPYQLGIAEFGVFLFLAVNFVPDFVSLLETRLLVRWAGRTGALVRLLALDLVLTGAVTLVWIFVVTVFLGVAYPRSYSIDARIVTLFFGVSAGSTFLTSAWLWLYAASVPASRILLRMNNGVGFLLRVTDVEKQPFRSVGFVSVIIVSALFALGLPLVLL